MAHLDARTAATLIDAELNKQAAMAAPGGTAAAVSGAAGSGVDFCRIWPQAKPILALIAGAAILIPGLGGTAGAVLKGLITVGDRIAAEVCKA